MNISASILKKTVAVFCVVALSAIVGNTAHAQVLLEVQVNATTGLVTITGENAAPGVTSEVGPFPVGDGIDLNGFFTLADGVGTTFFTSSLTGSLFASGSSLAFDQAAADLDSESNVQTALGLWNDGTGQLAFTSTANAFSGSLTLNLSGLTIGSHGDIVAGSPSITDGSSPVAVIGQWEVVPSTVDVPEPSSWMLLASSLGLLAWLRRFSRA